MRFNPARSLGDTVNGTVDPAAAPRPKFGTAQRLLILLVPPPLDVELTLLAPEVRRTFPLELVPVNRQLVVDGDLVIHELPHGGERQSTVLQLQVLEVRLLLVRPAHRPGEFVAVLLDRQRGHPLLPSDVI